MLAPCSFFPCPGVFSDEGQLVFFAMNLLSFAPKRERETERICTTDVCTVSMRKILAHRCVLTEEEL
jgi:hypothetical protein